MKLSGKDFKEIRRHLKMTHMQFARVLGYVGNASISRFENNVRKLPPTVARLAFMLGKFGVPREFEE